MAREAVVVMREILRGLRPLIFWYWPAIIVVYAVVVTLVARFGRIESSFWRNIGTEGPKWILFAAGVMFVAAFVPQFVATGFTRRHTAAGGAAFGAVLVAIWAAMVVAGFGVERILYTSLGYMDALTDPYPVANLGDALRFFVEYVFLGAAYVCSGALVGIGYYRAGAWRGTLLIPLGLLPAIGVEVAFRASWLGVGRQAAVDVPLLASVAVGLAVLAAGATAVYLTIRDLPIHPKGA